MKTIVLLVFGMTLFPTEALPHWGRRELDIQIRDFLQRDYPKGNNQYNTGNDKTLRSIENFVKTLIKSGNAFKLRSGDATEERLMDTRASGEAPEERLMDTRVSGEAPEERLMDTRVSG
ncbi:uncharacterized protein LOC132749932 isoform X1 [Ruditapes philippinarum]|uniref:uncharacterized protein LOC132749932 isoform X1 n=1 Tax=Ruditapes philippinarum TaxID=129788 RepID=UPI00295B7B8D|nr:uncharacterized protein LOC132749932 isoform X1 [Ruditapes philippinarum]